MPAAASATRVGRAAEWTGLLADRPSLIERTGHMHRATFKL